MFAIAPPPPPPPPPPQKKNILKFSDPVQIVWLLSIVENILSGSGLPGPMRWHGFVVKTL